MNTVPSLMGAPSAASQGMSSLLSSLKTPTTIGGLQAGSSVLSGLGTMMGDQSKASSYRIQSGEWATQAKDEVVSGANQVSGLKAQYLAQTGGATAKAAAGGVDVGQGTVGNARQAVGQNAVGTGQIDTLASDIRARRDTINQIQADEAAKQADNAGTMALIGGILGGGLKLLSAGVL